MSDANTAANRRELDRILHAPDLARIVPQLPPEVLHRAIQARGLEDAGELLAAATPEQLIRLADLDLWRAERPGRDETFDADRFGVWLGVLVDVSPAVAAQKLAEIELDLVVAGLVQHIRVFDRAAVAEYETTDGERMPGASFGDRLTADIGGHVLVATRDDAWDAILAVLAALAAGHPDRFGEVMRGCCSLSNAGREIDGLDALLEDGAQAMVDVAIARDGRREDQGYVGAADARAFLESSRRVRIVRTPQLHASTPPRVHVSTPPGALQTLLPRLACINAQMQYLVERDPAVYAQRNAELAFLSNVLMAGGSIQDRPFTEREAWDAAIAACNLGLETVEAHDGFLLDHDLTSAFQTGWTVLHDDVAMYAAERLTDVSRALRCPDRHILAGLHDLRWQLAKHLRAGTPWRARPAMDVLAALDMPAWAALLGLIAECPVLHAAIGAFSVPKAHAVNASEFEFIAQRVQIRAIREFLAALPEILRG